MTVCLKVLANSAIPGADIILRGIDDLEKGLLTSNACLVAIGAPRLERLGIHPPKSLASSESPEHALYDLLYDDNPRSVHSRYNALVRRLVSFEQALTSLSVERPSNPL